MEEYSGQVSSVIVYPGRADMMELTFFESEGVYCPLSPDEAGSNITWDGEKVSAAEVCARVLAAKGRVSFKGTSDVHRYGTVLVGRFETE